MLTAGVLTAAVVVLILAGRAMAAGKAPEVGYLSASHVSTTGATIEVPINPEGGETSWEIWLECQNAERSDSCEPLTIGLQRQQGILSPSFESQTVTDVVTGLQPDYLYKYRVVAINSAGKEGSAGDGFVTCPSEGSCPSQPYLRGVSLWVIEGAERAGNEAPRLEEEREAKKKEEEERPVKEAAERAAKEREAREAGERAGKEAAERERAAERAATTHSPKCIVPHLKGDSLTEARRALGRAHCRLGRLTEPRDYRGSLVVVRQSVRGGNRLAAGTRVALTLSRPEKR
jgi:hypothetical protein